MKLYDYDDQIINALEEAINPDTGEIIDDQAYQRLNDLMAGRDEKIENILLWIKDMAAEALAIKAEEMALAERRKSLERKIERVKDFIQRYLNGQKFKTAKVEVKYTKSESVDVFGEIPAFFQRVKTVIEPDKVKLKQFLKTGAVAGARLIKNISMSIK